MRTFALALFVSLVAAQAAHAGTQEVQGWLTPDIHVHTTFDAPMLQTLSSPLVMPVTTLLHHEVEPLSYVRWSDGSNVKQCVDVGVQGDAGAHRLHLRATGAGQAGAYVLAFTVAGAR